MDPLSSVKFQQTIGNPVFTPTDSWRELYNRYNQGKMTWEEYKILADNWGLPSPTYAQTSSEAGWEEFTLGLSNQTQAPLISSGVAQKLKEAGFSQLLVDPLTKSDYTQKQVQDLLSGSKKITGIDPPSLISPTTLEVTPINLDLSGLLPIGLGILAISLLKD